QDARAVVVRQQDVVIVGEETDRSFDLGWWARRFGEVEQLASFLVAEYAQSRAKSLEHRLDREAGPCPHVRRRGRTERAQVSGDEVLFIECGAGRPAEPGLERREGHQATRAPDAAGGREHQR